MRYIVRGSAILSIAAVANAVQTGGESSTAHLRSISHGLLVQQRHHDSSTVGETLRSPDKSFADSIAHHFHDEHAILDGFALTYWGVVFAAMTSIVAGTAFTSKSTEEPGVEVGDKLEASRDEDGSQDEDLPENMWSFNFICAMDQAKFSNGKLVPPWLVASISLFMGALQMFTIFLIVHDIDPEAEPVTRGPASPWKNTTWTIHCMKWIMVVFLIMGMVPEVSDSQRVLKAVVSVDPSRLRVPKFFSISMTLIHYFVTLGVIWGGVNVICSFGAVPDIVYSSLAISFLANIDNIFYEFFIKMFDVDADFKIVLQKGERKQVKQWMHMALKMLMVLPICWGMFLIWRAWRTNMMPAERLHHLKETIMGML